jgi:SOS-response transcriptional repressor LexA
MQKGILDLADSQNLRKMSLREIGRTVTGQDQPPQKIKYHIDCLIRDGLLRHEEKGDVLVPTSRWEKQFGFVSIPIVGNASCGPATQIADGEIVGYLSLSEKLIPNNHVGLFFIRAVGMSMNRAKVNGNKTIDDGDYVLVDGKNRRAENASYVLAVTGEVANIKKFSIGTDGQSALVSESADDYPPIFIHPEDQPDFFICGKVIDVFKKPQTT